MKTSQKEFPQIDGFKYSFSTIQDGNMSRTLDESSNSKSEINMKNYLSKNHFEFPIVEMEVEHGDKIIIVEEEKEGSYPCDAFITDKSLTLTLKPADCLPIIIYDTRNEALALVHHGWKSADKKLAQKVVQKLIKEFNSRTQDLFVILGPCIRKKSVVYQNIDNREEKLSNWGDFYEKINDSTFRIDISGYTTHQLVEYGISRTNIYDCKIDTVTDNNYFSHYRDNKQGKKDTGRFLCAVSLSPPLKSPL